MVLAEPCAVSCESGRGEIDAAVLDASTVLGGLSGHCAASTRADRLGCASGLCAFSGPANHSHSHSSGSRVREVCCVLETGSVQMAFPHAFNRSGGEQDARLPTQVLSSSSSSSSSDGSGTRPPILPAFYVSLTYGQRLASECGLLLNTDGKQYGALSSCTITILDEVTSGGGGGYWDGSALLIWLFGTLTASLAAYLAAYEHDMQDRQAARGIHWGGWDEPC